MIKKITDRIDDLLKKHEKIIIAIDGKSTSGKTTLTEMLQKIYDCNVFHIDDFYLPFEMRTASIMNEIGGNIHFERFINEVVNNLNGNKEFTYGVFSCADGKINKKIKASSKRINIIEGVYCMHQYIRNIYDLRIFLKISEEEQLLRLKQRDPDKLEQFINQWIPRENKYFDSINIEKFYDITIDMNNK